MDSETWFSNEGNKWKTKRGIYVLEQPLLNAAYGGKPAYKIGFARNNLYTRIRDYKTSYGKAHFKVHCVYQILPGVGNRRVNFDNLTEKIIHKTLKKEKDTWTGEGEWFYNISTIMNVIYALKKEYDRDITDAHKWLFYSPHPDNQASKVINLVGEDEIPGTFKDVKYGRETRQNTTIIDGKKFNIPKTYIDADGSEVIFERKYSKKK